MYFYSFNSRLPILLFWFKYNGSTVWVLRIYVHVYRTGKDVESHQVSGRRNRTGPSINLYIVESGEVKLF